MRALTVFIAICELLTVQHIYYKLASLGGRITRPSKFLQLKATTGKKLMLRIKVIESLPNGTMSKGK